MHKLYNLLGMNSIYDCHVNYLLLFIETQVHSLSNRKYFTLPKPKEFSVTPSSLLLTSSKMSILPFSISHLVGVYLEQ